MIIRLTVFTALLAFFALGFSALVEHGRGGGSAFAKLPNTGCYDQGAVCAPDNAR